MKLADLIRKTRKFTRYFYAVPWCVPPWGWEEARRLLGAAMRGKIVSGSYPEAFAAQVKNFLGVRYAIPVSHARFGIELALRALNVTAESEVILPSYLCQSVLDAVVRAGGKPVFADVDGMLHLTAAEVQRRITTRTRCVIVPHLFGNVAPVDEIESLLRDTGIALIDDGAQSLGAVCRGRRIGTFGAFGIVSIGPGKSLAGPAGGLLLTDSEDLYRRAAAIPLPEERALHVLRRMSSFWIWRRWRRWTWPFYMAAERVFDLTEDAESLSGMSNFDGAIAVSQFAHLSRNADLRKQNAAIFRDWLGDLAHGSISDFSGMLVKLVIVLPETGRSSGDWIEALADVGIEAQIGYRPLHPASVEASSEFPNANGLWERVLCIPVDTAMPHGLRPIRDLQ